jgi:hypothetical protein
MEETTTVVVDEVAMDVATGEAAAHRASKGRRQVPTQLVHKWTLLLLHHYTSNSSPITPQ